MTRVETADTIRVATFALVTGGGTGGHVYPALAVAEELVRARAQPVDAIRFVGARRGLEATAVPAAGFAIDLLPGRGLRRSLRPRALVANVGALSGTVGAFVRAFRLVGGAGPASCSASAATRRCPCVVAARLRRVPAVVHEQNAAPGLANRLGVRLGARAAVSLPGTPLRGAVLTGNPVRAEIAGVVREPATAPPLVVVVRREPRRAHGSTTRRSSCTTAGATAPTSRSATSPARATTNGARARLGSRRAAGRRARLRRSSRYEDAHGARCTRAATRVVCRAGAVTVRRARPSPACPRCSCRSRARRATTRRATPKRSSAPGAAVAGRPTPSSTASASPRELARCSPTRRGSTRMGDAGAVARRVPTPPRGSPTSWRRPPVTGPDAHDRLARPRDARARSTSSASAAPG